MLKIKHKKLTQNKRSYLKYDLFPTIQNYASNLLTVKIQLPFAWTVVVPEGVAVVVSAKSMASLALKLAIAEHVNVALKVPPPVVVTVAVLVVTVWGIAVVSCLASAL